ncbi:MAG: PQQ-binding-like beta-propeller repeat protein [Pseudomonadota bacterium]
MQLSVVVKKSFVLFFLLLIWGCGDGTSGDKRDSIPPSVPSTIHATQISAGSVSISWPAASDNVGVTGYNIFKNGTYLASVSPPSLTETGLSASAQYCYTVSAFDAQGNESAKSTAACIDKTPGTVLWKFETGGAIESAPAISKDGILYVASGDGCLYALHPDGTLKWKHDTEAALFSHSSPAIGPDGTIYLGSTAYLHAINPDGSTKWKYPANFYSTPAVGLDGTVYVGDRIQMFYAINPDGSLKWSHVTSGSSLYPPAIAPEGTIYAPWGDLYAVNRDGSVKWSSSPGGYHATPAISDKGTIYVGINNALQARNPDGTLDWQMTCQSTALVAPQLGFGEPPGYFFSPVIGQDSSIYAVSLDRCDYQKYLYAVHPGGTLKWKVLLPGDALQSENSTPAIGANGIIYLQLDDGNLTGFNPDGSIKWQTQTGGAGSSPAIADDGTIYVGSLDHHLYALDSESRGLANSSCPKQFQNKYNSSNYMAIGPEDTLAPDVPSNVQAMIVSPSMLSLTWDASTDNNGQATGYKLYRNGEYLGQTGIGFTDTGLTPSTRYCYGICAVDEAGNASGISPERCLETPPAARDGELKWKFQTGTVTDATSLSKDGSIFLSSLGGYTYALTKNGTLKWKRIDLGHYTTLSSDDTLYTITGWPDFNLIAFTSEGSVKWTFPNSNYDAFIRPAIAEDGTIYAGNESGHILAITPEGTLQWELDTISRWSTPIVASTGMIYVQASPFYAISPEGVIQWQHDTGNVYQPAYAIGAEGTIYIPGNGELLALNPDGSLKWKRSGSPFSLLCGTVVVGPGEVIYIGSKDGYLHAFDGDGTVKWSYLLTSDLGGGLDNVYPVLGAGGIVYVAPGDGYLYAVRADGSLKWFFSLGGVGSGAISPSIDPDGTLYVGSGDGYFYAIQTDSMGLADSSWPKVHHDNQNSGRMP